MLEKWLIKIFEDTESRIFWVVNSFLGGVIIASLVVLLLEADPDLYLKYGPVFVVLEYFFTAIFTIEYIIYIYLSRKKLSYIFSFYGIVDLLSVLPTYLALSSIYYFQVLRVVRLLRLFRLIRLLKIVRLIRHRYQKEQTDWQLVKLNFQIYIASYVLLLMAFSVVLFHIEQGVPDTQIKTIQDAIWSVISALSSVGFGDTFPASFPGRVFLGFVMLTGVGFLSFAILIVGKVLQYFIFGEEITEELKEFSASKRKFKKIHKLLLKKEGEETIN